MKSKFAMSESQVEALAGEYATAAGTTARVGMTYLRVIVVACQAILGTKRRGRVPHEAQLEVIADVTGKYYAAVLRGVTTPDVAPDDKLDKAEQTRRARERNRRSTFARSVKSTLSSYVNAGGDLRGLEADTVTRDPLLSYVREQRGTREAAHKLERYTAAIVRLATRGARDDPSAAAADLERAIEALQFALDGIMPSGNVEARQAERAPDPSGNRIQGAVIPLTPRGQAPREMDPLTMTGVLRTRPAHARHAAGRA